MVKDFPVHAMTSALCALCQLSLYIKPVPTVAQLSRNETSEEKKRKESDVTWACAIGGIMRTASAVEVKFCYSTTRNIRFLQVFRYLFIFYVYFISYHGYVYLLYSLYIFFVHRQFLNC